MYYVGSYFLYTCTAELAIEQLGARWFPSASTSSSPPIPKISPYPLPQMSIKSISDGIRKADKDTGRLQSVQHPAGGSRAGRLEQPVHQPRDPQEDVENGVGIQE